MKRPFVCSNTPIVVKHVITGFTLTELITVLTIAGILAAFAGPAMTTFIHSNRLTGTTNEFLVALNLARSEAMKRGVSAGVCKSDDGATCTATGSWENGWIVFLDGDNNGPWTGSDSMIRARESLPSGIALADGPDAVIYNRQGLVPGASPDPFVYTICSSRLGKARTIRIGAAGRANLSEDPCP